MPSHLPTPIILSTCNDLNEVPDQSAEKHLVEFLSHKSSTPHTVAGELSSPSAEVKFMNLLQLTQLPKRREVIHCIANPVSKFSLGLGIVLGEGTWVPFGTCTEEMELLPREPECKFATQK